MSRTYSIIIPKTPKNKEFNYYWVISLCQEICLGQLHDKAWNICKIDRCNECDTDLNDMVDQYETIPTDDLTVRIYDYDDEIHITQVASGGHLCRKMKDACRKAFMILFLEKLFELHEGFDVRLSY